MCAIEAGCARSHAQATVVPNGASNGADPPEISTWRTAAGPWTQGSAASVPGARPTVGELTQGSGRRSLGSQRVFQTGDYHNTWDAQGLPDGLYYYLLRDADDRRAKGWVEVRR